MLPKFPPGQSVKSRSTEQRGKVVHNTLHPEGHWVVIVDIPHGQATLRRHFDEADLEEVRT